MIVQVEILRAAHNVVISTQMAGVAELEETAAQLEAAACRAGSSSTVGGSETEEI